MGVIPGSVFASRHHGFPSLSTIKSNLEYAQDDSAIIEMDVQYTKDGQIVLYHIDIYDTAFSGSICIFFHPIISTKDFRTCSALGILLLLNLNLLYNILIISGDLLEI